MLLFSGATVCACHTYRQTVMNIFGSPIGQYRALNYFIWQCMFWGKFLLPFFVHALTLDSRNLQHVLAVKCTFEVSA